MGFRSPLLSLSGDDITPGTITGSTLQTAASGQRIVIMPGTGPGENVIRLYSGHPREIDWGELSASVSSDGDGNTYPHLYLSAPNTKSGAYAGFLHLRSGDSDSNTQGFFELNTGDGSGWDTPVSVWAETAGAGFEAQFVVDVAQPGVGSGNGLFELTSTLFNWTNAHDAGFFHYSDGTADYLQPSGDIRLSPGRKVVAGAKATPTYAASFVGGSAASTRYAPLTYRVTAEGMLHVVGHCRSSIARAVGTYTLFTLPAGVRPAQMYSTVAAHVSNTDAWKTACRFNVDSTGAVTLATTSAVVIDDGFYINALVPMA
ncbi:hypothetical protein [Streptomyces laurentii]|uniref:hypothetical protein n=1 Tax=Streptomyces laurentii TaxID=39478 RepID=UPI0036A28F52